jgi:predicted RNA-binding Zn-ribbon protein involved in translation (DUF1610 family)
MPDCIFTCPTCGREIPWNNERENEPVCPTCSGRGGKADADTFECNRCHKVSSHRRASDPYAGNLWICPSCGYKTPRWECKQRLAPQSEMNQEMSNQQFKACPNCGSTGSEFTGKYDLCIFRCSCGKTYCDDCSLGGTVDLPLCPVSAYHEGRKKIGIVPKSNV